MKFELENRPFEKPWVNFFFLNEFPWNPRVLSCFSRLVMEGPYAVVSPQILRFFHTCIGTHTNDLY